MANLGAYIVGYENTEFSTAIMLVGIHVLHPKVIFHQVDQIHLFASASDTPSMDKHVHALTTCNQNIDYKWRDNFAKLALEQLVPQGQNRNTLLT